MDVQVINEMIKVNESEDADTIVKDNLNILRLLNKFKNLLRNQLQSL